VLTQCVRLLLQEHKTDEMHTALMEASMDGHVEVARLLLDSGAQVSTKFNIPHAIHVMVNETI
jgi:ankyrin repeat protein